jgi:molybdopterin converting factor small subunit
MKVRVRYLAQLKQAAGLGAETVELEGPCAAREFVANLAERHGGPLRGLLLTPGGQVQPTILIFVGDEQVAAGASEALRDGDEVTLLSPIAGGGRP